MARRVTKTATAAFSAAKKPEHVRQILLQESFIPKGTLHITDNCYI